MIRSMCDSRYLYASAGVPTAIRLHGECGKGIATTAGVYLALAPTDAPADGRAYGRAAAGLGFVRKFLFAKASFIAFISVLATFSSSFAMSTPALAMFAM